MKIYITLFVLLIIPLLLLIVRNWKVQNGPLQKEFLKGTLPSPLPNGFFKGSAGNLKTNWKGKVFDASSSSGINLFEKEKKYPFKTYRGIGIQDNNLEVLKIDYNIPKNPILVRLILDEIVQLENNKYLGKVHLNLIPNFPISLGFFRLEGR